MAPRFKAIKETEYNGTMIEFIFDSLTNKRKKVLSKLNNIKKTYGI